MSEGGKSDLSLVTRTSVLRKNLVDKESKENEADFKKRDKHETARY